MKMFPASETRKNKQQATVFLIFSAVLLLWQLNGCVPFMVEFKFSDMVVQFLFPLSRSQMLVLPFSSLSNVTLFIF